MSRRRSASRGRAVTLPQLPWQLPKAPFAPLELLDPDQVQRLVEASLDVLERSGMRFLEAESRKLLRAAGARVDESDQMVRFDRDMVRELASTAPAHFGLRARNPARDLVIGGRNIVFSSVGGPAFCSDLDRGRRPGTYAELCDYLKLVQCLNAIHQEGGGPFEALDLPTSTPAQRKTLAQHFVQRKRADVQKCSTD